MIKSFFNAITMTSGKCRDSVQKEMEELNDSFKSENPSIAEKREKAIAYLGDRWILSKTQQRLDAPRQF